MKYHVMRNNNNSVFICSEDSSYQNVFAHDADTFDIVKGILMNDADALIEEEGDVLPPSVWWAMKAAYNNIKKGGDYRNITIASEREIDNDGEWDVTAPTDGSGDYMEDALLNEWMEKLYQLAGDVVAVG